MSQTIKHQANSQQGELVCVGTGMRLAGQLTPISKSHIETADVVVGAVANQLSRDMLQRLSKEFICLWSYYGDGSDDGTPRNQSYRQMADKIIELVKQGKKVCAAFYGHPGVFACIGNMAIKDLQKQGYRTQMLPAISAEDCLVADLGIDPGERGMQSMEATQYLINQRNIDTGGLFIVWQPGIVGDLSMKKFVTTEQKVALLVEKLARIYPHDHQVILYEAATNPLQQPRIDYLSLSDVPAAPLSQITTLVIPAATSIVADKEFRAKLSGLGNY